MFDNNPASQVQLILLRAVRQDLVSNLDFAAILQLAVEQKTFHKGENSGYLRLLCLFLPNPPIIKWVISILLQSS